MENQTLNFINTPQEVNDPGWIYNYPMVQFTKGYFDNNDFVIELAVGFSTPSDITPQDFSLTLDPVQNGGDLQNPILFNINYTETGQPSVGTKYWFVELKYTTDTIATEIYAETDLLINPNTEKPIRKRGTVCIAKKSPFPD